MVNLAFFMCLTAEDVVRAGNSLEELRTECPSLKFPDRIYATNLRKYCATIAQVSFYLLYTGLLCFVVDCWLSLRAIYDLIFFEITR